MLYGSETLQNDILQDAFSYAKKNNLRLVYGAMVGSISQGLQYANSDYDTRFLYVREDFPEKICDPSIMRENELVYRYYLDNKVYEWIPFWEMTSFLKFVYRPEFKDCFSLGLYNIVGWTFQSPYNWDPYGLKSVLLPLINLAFNADYKVSHQRKILDKYRSEWYSESIIAKSLLYSIHAAATIEWSLLYNEEPPVYIFSLLLGLGHNDIACMVEKILVEARAKCDKEIEKGVTELHGSHFSVTVKMNSLLLSYLEKTYQYGDMHNKKSIDESKAKDLVDSMLNLLHIVVC